MSEIITSNLFVVSSGVVASDYIVDVDGEIDIESGGVLTDSIATNGGMLRLLEVQRPGARAVSGGDFLRGCPVRVMQNFDAPDPDARDD